MKIGRLLAFLLLACLTAQAQTTYLHVTFDSGTFSEWDSWYDASGCAVPGINLNVSASPAYSGAYSGAVRYSVCGVQTPPAGTLGSTGTSTYLARTYYVTYTYVSTACRNTWSGHQTYPSAEQSVNVGANQLLNITTPAAQIAIDRYMVYAGTVSGTRYLQTTTPATVGVDWTEPDACPGGHTCIAGTGLVNDTVTTPTTSDACPHDVNHSGGGGYWTHTEAMPGLEHVFYRGFLLMHKNDAGSDDGHWQGCGKLTYFKSSDSSKWHTLSCAATTGTYPGNTWFALFIGNTNAPGGGEPYTLDTQTTRAPYACQASLLSTCSSTHYHWLYDNWYYVELETKPNTVTPSYIRDGEIRLWVQCMSGYGNTCTPDSGPVEVAEIINANIRGTDTTALTSFEFGRQIDEGMYPLDVTKYWDEIVMADHFIGSSLSAASPTPVSLTFNNCTVPGPCVDSPRIVTLTNQGTETLNITSINVTGTNAADFPKTTTCGSTLAPAASCTVSVSFTPSATGARTANLVFTDDAADSPQTVLLSGTGTAGSAPVVSLSSSGLDFDARVVGTTSPTQMIVLYNSGDAVLNITSIVASTTSAPTSPGDFAIDSTTCGATLAAAASCVVNVSFTPVAGGSRTGRIRFTTDAATSPDDVSTSGTGQIVLTLRGGTFRISKPD